MASLPPFPAPNPAVEPLGTRFDLTYTWDYETTRRELRHLYEQAKTNQWNAATAIDWTLDVDPERENVPDQQFGIYGSVYWNRLTPAEILRLRHEQAAWMLSQLMHGEQGALLATAQLVDATPTFDAKLYASTQVMDEARHVEVFEKYLREKLACTYPVNPSLRTLLDQILTDSRWDMKYLGMQIMVEGLALAIFHFLHDMGTEPLLRQILRVVIRDEARHVAFGVLGLRDFYADMPEREVQERVEFIYEAAVLMRDRLVGGAVMERMGMPVDECVRLIQQAESMAEFRKLLFSRIVPNVKRLGLLTPWLREKFAEIDILKFEDWETTDATYMNEGAAPGAA